LSTVSKSCFLCILFISPLLSGAQTRESKSQIILRREINFLIKKSNTPRTVKGIEIYSRKHKKPIYDFNSGFLFNPASNLKIATTSFALQNLGVDYKFKTSFVAPGARHASAIDGDLFVMTCGDPLITHQDIDSVASAIYKNGVRGIDGNLIIDVSRFDSVEWGSGWMWNDEPGDYQMFVSPACLDHNTISVNVSLDSLRNNVIVKTDPSTQFVRTIFSAIPDAIDSLHVTRVMLNDTNVISVSGFYSPFLQPSEYTFSVRHPARYFGTVFKEALATKGIEVQGKTLVNYDRQNRISGTTLDTLFTLEHSIDTVVTYINKVSDNLGAECLLKEVAYDIQKKPGSADAGVRLEEEFLKSCGVDSTEYSIVDGSGLSRYNLMTPDAIVSILNHDLGQPFGNLLLHSLPVSDVDGTLEDRMNQDFVAGKILAKTGSISGVSTLSGYVLLPNDTLVFSMMMQNFVTSGDSLRALQDSLCKVISLYSDNSRIFKKKLREHNVGTYWAAYQSREMNRMKRNSHFKHELRKNPSTGR
jgi:D-alanyl-D-alanine carboxypeptidase/D-alanyl-D-alanine-endopeptidase (penicillin-binding protein 4)